MDMSEYSKLSNEVLVGEDDPRPTGYNVFFVGVKKSKTCLMDLHKLVGSCPDPCSFVLPRICMKYVCELL